MRNEKKLNLLPCVLAAWLATVPMSVYASVTEYQSPDAKAEEYSADCDVIYSKTYDFSEEIPKYPEGLEASAFGYDGTYDGKKHGITVSIDMEDCKILYSEDGKNYSEKKPLYVDVGTYITYYRIEADGAVICEGKETIKIAEAGINYTAGDYNGSYDGMPHGIYLSVLTSDCEVLYSEDGVTYSSKKPEYKEAGTYVVYYKIMKDNYKTVTGSNKVVIEKEDQDKDSIIHYVAGDYSGVEDGKLHSIFVKVYTEGCEILYSEDGVNYSLHNPEYSKPGTYVVYYKIVKDDNTTVTGSRRVIIQKKDGMTNNDQNSNHNNGGNNSYNNSNHMPDKNTGASNVQTGDENYVLLYLAMLAASAFGMKKWKKRGSEE